MKKNNIFLLLFALLFTVASCELPDNVDPKHATQVPVSTLITNAQVAMAEQITTTDYNDNIGFLLAQYFSEVTYTNESRYDFQDRGVPDNYFNTFYRHVLMDLKEAKTILAAKEVSGAVETERDNQVAIIDIMEVYVYHNLVDAFGGVPYAEALLGAEKSNPKYDDAAAIYEDLFSRLDANISALNSSEGSFGGADLIFGGDVDSWRRFANSLKFRMAMRLSDVSSSSQARAEAAIASGIFTAQSQSAIFRWLGVSPHVNNIYRSFIENGRTDLVPTELVVNTLNTLNDPRRPFLFTQVGGVYLGLEYGKENSSSYALFSHFSAPFFTASFESVLIDYTEMEFLLAEAAERGWTVTGTAESHYNAGITASVEYWGGVNGVADVAADVATYLAQPSVAYATATGTWKQKIGTQKWIALYYRGNEGWAEWRRLDFPVLTPPEGMTQADIPNRYPYPYKELSLNKANYEAAAAAVGGDKASTKLFWDVN